MIDGSVFTSLVIAKAKIASLKKLTLPRPELLGCLLCSRLLVFARDALQLPQDCVYCCWTDLIIALSWIRSHTSRWKTFNVRESKAQTRGGEVTYRELQDARRLLLQKVQKQECPDELRALRQGQSVSKSLLLFKLTPYIADDGLLRMKGRLQFSHLSFDEKHPILLPKCHLVVLLVRFKHVLMKHAGVLTMITALGKCYWIICVRRIAIHVKKTCASCQRQDAAACSQPMAPLPPERVNPAVSFAVTGLDHAGPLYWCDLPRKKFWILLFTCGVVRAVHLELVESLSTLETILDIRRLSAQRGLPEVIYSYNAKGFTASPTALQRQFGHVTPELKLIAPHSPWWGGWRERLVQSVKSALKKTIGAHCLTRTELETTIQEVEACINSQPLTFVSD